MSAKESFEIAIKALAASGAGATGGITSDEDLAAFKEKKVSMDMSDDAFARYLERERKKRLGSTPTAQSPRKRKGGGAMPGVDNPAMDIIKLFTEMGLINAAGAQAAAGTRPSNRVTANQQQDKMRAAINRDVQMANQAFRKAVGASPAEGPKPTRYKKKRDVSIGAVKGPMVGGGRGGGMAIGGGGRGLIRADNLGGGGGATRVRSPADIRREEEEAKRQLERRLREEREMSRIQTETEKRRLQDRMILINNLLDRTQRDTTRNTREELVNIAGGIEKRTLEGTQEIDRTEQILNLLGI